jgi:hypothetical protein
MAKYMRDIFGEKLCSDVDPALSEMPSPDMLKYKILIKVRLCVRVCVCVCVRFDVLSLANFLAECLI